MYEALAQSPILLRVDLIHCHMGAAGRGRITLALCCSLVVGQGERKIFYLYHLASFACCKVFQYSYV